MVRCWSNTGMDSDAVVAIRRRRLREAADRWFGGNEAALARAVQRAGSQVADMIAGRKSFGEKVARSLEENLRKSLAQRPGADGFILPPLWLDAPDDSSVPPSGGARGSVNGGTHPVATHVREAMSWPFSGKLYQRFRRLDDDQKRDVEEALEDHVSRLERRSRPPRKSKAG